MDGGDLLEEFRDVLLRHNKQQWPEDLAIEEYQIMSEKQINLEPFIHYYYHIDAIPKVSSKRRRKETEEIKRSSNNRLSTYVNDDPVILYTEEKEVVKGEEDYPEVIRSDDLIRITAQTSFLSDKDKIKAKIYDDSSIEISINDGHSL
jgi:hypothetical protein